MRKALGAGRIEYRSSGYVLVTDPNDVDLVRFEGLVDEAHRLTCTDPSRAVVAFREAVGLWRGPALDDLAEQPSLRPEITRLEESRLAAIEEMVTTDLTLGRDRDLVPELETLVHRHPYRERLWGQLMIALYRSGRQGDALAAYQRARRVLLEELGIDPSPDLQRIQQQILQQDVELEVTGEPLRGYRLIERIGEGPLGVVSRARQPHMEREVAIKVLPSELANDPDFVRRFEHDARLVARLEHPHAVPLYDYWRDPDGAYLVMRLLRGGSLKEWIDRSGPLPPDGAAEMLEQVASALAAAHREGIVHGDLKPANVLLDEDGNAYVSDFGIAIESSASRRKRSPPTGVASYLAPEQTRGDAATPASDVYALGVVMYEALTARHPFVDRSPGAVGERRPCDGLPSVLSLRPDLPPAVDGVLARATEQDPDLRFGDAPSVAAAFRLAIGAESVEPTRAPATELANPYKGLRAFDEPDAADFFGRERMTERLVARLAEETDGSRLLAVVGPSGSGKSSLVRAGLLPALRRGALPGSDAWFVTSLVPGARPFEELEVALLRVAIDPPAGLAEQLQRDERGLPRAVERILPRDGTELVLVVDQLEELFTLTGRESERSAFLAALVQATTDRQSRLRVIVTLRADFYDRPLLDPGFGPLLAARTEAITPLVPEELERAIVGPADRVGVSLEPSLVAEMVADVAHQPGALPLLQYSLTELFGRRRDRTMTSAAYHELGGVSGALAARAEELFTAFDAAGHEACRQMFLRLVAPGEGAEDTRRRVPRAELDALEGERGSMEFAIGAFGRHRLLSFDRDQLTRGPTVELAHEALIRAWSRLRDWIDEGREDLRAHRRLAASTDEWLASGRGPGFLATGARLERLSSWVSETRLALGRSEREFVEESLRRHDEEAAVERARVEQERSLERRAVRRMRALVAVLATAALVAATLTVVAVNQRGRAERASRSATARELAGAAMANIDVDADRSLLLALQAVETTRGSDGTVSREAEEALHAALQAHRLLLSVPGVDDLEFSPDGTRLVTGGEDGAIHTYETATGKPLLTIQDSEAAEGRVAQHDLHFSPDGALIASSSGTLWDAESGEQVKSLPFGGPASFSIPFSPDGRFVAAQLDSAAGTGVWEMVTGEQVSSLEGYGYLAFAPDDRRLLIADNYQRDPELGWIAGYVVDWRQADGGGDRVVLLGHERANTTGAAWSPDGSMVATSAATEVLVWDPNTADRKYTLTSDADFTSVAFSPDSRRIATGMGDGTAIVWTLSPDGAKPVLTVAGHETGVDDVGFSPDGRQLATTGLDGEAKIWDVTPEGSHEWMAVPGTQGVAYSPDGRFLAASTSDEEVPVPEESAPADVHLYEADSGRRIATFRGHEDEILSLAFDPSGTRLASAAQDGTARIWDVAGERPPLTLTEEIPGQPGALTPVVDVAFSPDGGTLATTTSEGGLIRTWDATTGAQRRTLEDGSGTPVLGNWEVEFSPDGTLIAAPSDDAVYVWDGDTGRLAARLPHPPSANDLEFSPDGDDLITASVDGRLRIWDTKTWDEERSVAAGLGQAQIVVSPQGDQLATLSEGTIRLRDPETLEERLVAATGVDGRGVGVDPLAFSPDGSRLAAHIGGVVSVYALDIDDLVRLARERLTRSWIEEECRTYLHLDECPSTTR